MLLWRVIINGSEYNNGETSLDAEQMLKCRQSNDNRLILFAQKSIAKSIRDNRSYSDVEPEWSIRVVCSLLRRTLVERAIRASIEELRCEFRDWGLDLRYVRQLLN